MNTAAIWSRARQPNRQKNTNKAGAASPKAAVSLSIWSREQDVSDSNSGKREKEWEEGSTLGQRDKERTCDFKGK